MAIGLILITNGCKKEGIGEQYIFETLINGQFRLDFELDTLLPCIVSQYPEILKDAASSQMSSILQSYETQLKNEFHPLIIEQKPISHNANTALTQYFKRAYLRSNIDNFAIDDEVLNTLNSELLNTEFLSFQDKYHFLELLVIRSKLFDSMSQIDESLISCLYGLALIQNDNTLNIHGNMSDRLIKHALATIAREPKMDNYQILIAQLINQASEPFKKSNSFKILYYYLNLENEKTVDKINFLTKDYNSFNKFHKYIVDLNLAFLYENIDRDSSKLYYLSAYNVFNSNSCSRLKFMPLIYNIELQDSINLKQSLAHCPPTIANYVNWVASYYSEYPGNLDKRITVLLDERFLMKKIFKGLSSFHLQDYLASNTSFILNSYSGKGNLTIKDATLLEGIIQETFQYNQKRKDNLSYLKKNKVDPDYLQHLNNVNSLNDFDKKYINDYQHLVAKSTEEKWVTSDSILLKNRKNNFELDVDKYVYFAHDSSYYVLEILNSKIQLKKLDRYKLNNAIDQLLTKIINKENHQNEVIRVSKLLNIDFNQTKTELKLISNDKINNIPLDVVFPNYNIDRIKQKVDFDFNDTLFIERKNIKLYSYSDSLTINTKEVLVAPELSIGYSECLNIKNLLHLNEGQLVSGSNFNSTSFFELDSIDFVHISTHANYNETNRLDNYILVHGDKSRTQKLYGYDLIKINTMPKVVILSACETGLSKFDVGTEDVSMSSIFLENGTQSIIFTLWNVNEEATRVFMEYLYNSFMSGKSIKQALNDAKHSLQNSNKYAHPYYWAGFVLEGNPNVYYKKE